MNKVSRAMPPKRTLPSLPPEVTFVIIGLIFGSLLIYSNPPFQSNDEDRHFFNAYFLASGQFGPRQDGDKIGGVLPSSVFNSVMSFQGIAFKDGVQLSEARVRSLAQTPLAASNTSFVNNANYVLNPLPYAPFSVGIAISRVLNSSPISIMRSARFTGLVAFLVIVAIAIRITPIHKYTLMAVALTPMTLYQASSVSYDTLCMALAFLITALCLSYTTRDRELSLRELTALVVLAVALRFMKNGYFLIPALFLMIPQRVVGARWKSVVIAACLVAAAIAPMFTWDVYLTSLNLRGGQELQNDFYFDSMAQLRFHSADPLQFAWLLIANCVFQAKEWIIGLIGRFGYSYTRLPQPIVFFHGLVLLVMALIDSNPKISLSWRQKAVAFVVWAGTASIIIGGFFLISPVGAHQIYGLQGRYFLPIVPIFMLLHYSDRIHLPPWDKWKGAITPVYCSVVLAYAVHFINGSFWRP